MTPKALSAVLLLLIAWRLTPRYVSNSDYQSHLKDKMVLVSDAGSALGTELAYNLAAHGSRLLLVFSLSGREKMLQTLSNGKMADPKERGMLTRAKGKRTLIQEKALSLGSPQVEILSYDYGNLTGIQTLVETSITQLGGLDYLVMNHEEVARGSGHTTDALTRSLNVNVLSYIELLRTARPHLQRSSLGHVFIASSILGTVKSAELPVYSVTKSALSAFFSGIKQELGLSSVRLTIGQLGGIATSDRQPLFNVPGWMRGDVENEAQSIVQSLIVLS